MTSKGLIAKVSVSSVAYSVDKPYDYRVPLEYENIVFVGQRVIVPFGNGNRRAEGFIVKLEDNSSSADLGYALKSLIHVYTDEARLSKEDIAVAMWMRQRYFCTFFSAANAMIPPGVWSKNVVSYGPSALPAEEARLLARGKIKPQIVDIIYAHDKRLTQKELEKECQSPNLLPHLKELAGLGAITVTSVSTQPLKGSTIISLSLAIPLEQARLQLGSGQIAKKRQSVIDCIAQAGELPEKEVMYLTGVSQTLIMRLCQMGILQREKADAFKPPKMILDDKRAELELSKEQTEAFLQIRGLLDSRPHAAMLMGVTGSGKTSVYIKLIKEVLEQGRGAILLVPEIALTPQMVRVFYSHFGETVAVIHSAMTHTRRYDEYKRIKQGKAKVVVGTRTGVFAPLNNIGIIIIDEEQEYSYKSDADPRYHAVDVAKYRSVMHNCLLLLGSATPSVVSYHKAINGSYSLFKLKNRFNNMPLPQTFIDDMRVYLKEGNNSQVGDRLCAELAQNLEKGEQSVLFINRRGSAKMAMCGSCAHIPMCENCSVALVYHSKNNRLMCHHCGFSAEMPESCPQCGSTLIQMVGSGTQSVEEELGARFPGIKILRMDSDTTVGRTSHEDLLATFEKGAADVLVGTQMVTKGLDFDNVTLVGVLDADLSLYQGEYRAGERTFSLISQVVGRAGRALKPGRAVIQSFSPENPVIMAAASQDYEAFFESEIQLRQAQLAPPFCDMVVFTLSGMSENTTLGAALGLSATISKLFDEKYSALKTTILGPVSAPIARLNKRYRFVVSFRGQDNKDLRELISRVTSGFYASAYSKEVAIVTEINP